ncbi:MAG TPA: iron-containing redox enzyme family protein, partial [Nocardioides sp.]|nr:iron-containing redox enzyme family protein [Nocardioides sp.]
RRLRAAAMGHLAAFETTSSIPSRRLSLGLQRLGFDRVMVDYYTEHVTADAVHDQLACRSICGALVAEEPSVADEVFFGAFTCLDPEARYAARMLSSWQPVQEETG